MKYDYSIVEKIDKSGVWYFPFKEGVYSEFVLDDSLTKLQFLQDKRIWESKKGYRYTATEMNNQWKMIMVQRMHLQAWLLVNAGVKRGINPALKFIYEKNAEWFVKNGLKYFLSIHK